MSKVELKVKSLKLNDSNTIEFSRERGFLAQYLLSLGINKKDLISFLDKPRDTDADDPEKLDNIAAAAETLVRRLDCGAQVFIQVDSDTDGYTSAAILYDYLKRRWPTNNIIYRLHTGKEHGVLPETVPPCCSVVLIPDAGSNQFEDHRFLDSLGKVVIVLDHHEVDNLEDTPALIVNNQLSKDFTNKNLSGAGVTYMFIQYLDKHYFAQETPIYEDYRDVAAVGIIADGMQMTSLGNNYLVYYGLRNIKNKFIAEVAQKQARGIENPKCLTKIDVAFYIAPLINGAIRYGTVEDKEIMFKALATYNDDGDYQSEWRGVVRHENLYQYAVRLASNAKGRQDSAKKKSFEWVCNKIAQEGWDKDNIIVVALDSKDSTNVYPTLTGLIAMELVNHYNKPALLLRRTELDGEDVYGGSGRNGNFYGIPNLKEFLHQAGVYYVEGHASAFGCYARPNEIQKIRDYANTQLSPSAFESVYQVDYWFDNKHSVDYDMLAAFCKHKELWGNSIPQPKFAFSGSYTARDTFFMGKDKHSLKIHGQGVDFVMFKAQKIIEQFITHPEGSYLIVGRPQFNEYNGVTSVQIMIDYIELNSTQKQETTVKSLMDLI